MRLRTFIALITLAGCFACVMAVEPERHNPVPFVERLDPAFLQVSAADAAVDLVGSDFAADAEVTWNGSPRPTEFESSSRVRVLLRPEDVAEPGSHTLAVVNPSPGGGASPSRTLEVVNSVPRIDSIRPSGVDALTAGAVTVRVYGGGFTDAGPGSSVLMDQVGLPTVVVSNAELHARLGEHLLRRAGEWRMQVANPAPGGGRSAPAPFQVLSPAPEVSGVAPDSVRITLAAEIHLTGANFMPGATVWLDTTRYEPSWMSRDSMVVHVPAVTHRDGVIRVENPGPGGGLSPEVTIGIQERQPVITYTRPQAFEVGEGTQTVRIEGSYLAPDAVVTWNSRDQATTVIDENTLEITIEGSRLETVAHGTLRVRNPRGGGTSGHRTMPTVPVGRVAYGNFWGTFAVARLNGADRRELSLPGDVLVDWLDTWPTGDELLYATQYGEVEDRGLFRRLPDGEAQRLTTDPAGSFSLSPDGAWVYFTEDGSILRMRPDGTGREIVLSAPPDSTMGYPDPSPSGDRLLYFIDERGYDPTDGGDLRILDLSTGDVTSLGVAGLNGRWSPDGTWIAYLSARRLRMMRPDGTESQVIEDAGRLRAGGFDWSPDGRYLLTIPWGTLRLIDIDTGVSITVPRADCNCEWAERESGWVVSWYPNPTGS